LTGFRGYVLNSDFSTGKTTAIYFYQTKSALQETLKNGLVHQATLKAMGNIIQSMPTMEIFNVLYARMGETIIHSQWGNYEAIFVRHCYKDLLMLTLFCIIIFFTCISYFVFDILYFIFIFFASFCIIIVLFTCFCVTCIGRDVLTLQFDDICRPTP